MSTTSGESDKGWQVRGALESGGLRVLNLRQVPDRVHRWSVHVLAEESTERDIRALTGVDVVRYRQLDGEPGQFVVTVDESRPDPTTLGSHPLSRTRRGPGRWSQQR